VTDPVPLSTVSVTVHVLDVNDNSPQFHEVSPRLIHIGNHIAAGSSVAQMLATDADSGRYGNVIYQLAPGRYHSSYYRAERVLKLLTLISGNIIYC